MNADDLEHRLQRQPLRAPPAAWRDEILAAAVRGLDGEQVATHGDLEPNGIPLTRPSGTLSRRTGEGRGEGRFMATAGAPSPAAGGAHGTARPAWLRRFRATEPDREAPGLSSASLRRRLRDWRWPHPVAWGVLAACWATVVLLNSAADAPLIASVRLTVGSTSALALQATDWSDISGPAFAPQSTPPARGPSPKLPSPTSSSVRRHETQVA